MAIILPVACAACAGVQIRQMANKKRPLRPPRGRKGAIVRCTTGAPFAEAPGIRTRPSAVPPRIRRIVAVPTRLPPRRAHGIRAESGHRCNGLARTDLLARMHTYTHTGVSSVAVLVGDLPRNGSGGTCSRVTCRVARCTQSRSLGGACRAYSSQRSGRHQPTVADTIANDSCACQVHPGHQSTFHVKRNETARFPRWTARTPAATIK